MASNKWYIGSTIPNWEEMTKEEQEIASLEQDLRLIRGRLNKLRETEETKQRYRQTIQKILDALGPEEDSERRAIDHPDFGEVMGDVAFLFSKHEEKKEPKDFPLDCLSEYLGEVFFRLSELEEARRNKIRQKQLARHLLTLSGFDEDEVEGILDNSDFEFVDGVLNLSSKEEADDNGV